MKQHRFEAIESEIRKEKAEALGRVGERLEWAIRELETIRQQFFGVVEAGPDPVLDARDRFPAEVEQKLMEYARLYEQATRLRHALIIQREAVGLWKHDDVDRQYPIPGPLTLPRAMHPEGGW